MLDSCRGFQWDQGNGLKNWLKHAITQIESEQVFLNEPLLLFEDHKHSEHEDRFLALGMTDEERCLVVAFTVREDYIRVISARSMRLPLFMLNEIKVLANKKDVPYQSLMKVFLAEKVKEELAT